MQLGGCKSDGGILHVALSPGVASPTSYCVTLSAGGARRFGRRYETAAYPLPQSLGVRADGQSTMVVRLDGLLDGLRTLTSAQTVALPGDATISIVTCAPKVAPEPLSLRSADSFPFAAQRIAFVRTGLELPGASSLVAVSNASGVIASYPYGRDGKLAIAPAPGGGSTVEALASLDIDGDCADDLLVAADGAPVAAWSTSSSGAISVDGARLADPEAAHALAVGDLDGDGWADLVKIGVDGGSVLLSDRKQGFVRATGFSVQPTNSTAAAIGDLDQDGISDLLVGFSDGPLLWTRGDGTGGFTGLTALPGTSQTAAVALFDLDHDGALDVIAGTTAGLAVYRNDGQGSFTDVSATLVPPGLDTNIVALRVVDTDGDCALDLLVAGATTAPHLLALGASGLVDRGAIGTDPVRDLDAADLDGDGLPEVVGVGFTRIEIYSTTASP